VSESVMKKILLLFATFALLLSIIVSIPSVSTFAQNGTKTYENEEFGLTLEHLSEWKPVEPSSFETELVGGRPYVIRMETTRTNRPMVEIDVDKSDSASLEQYVSEQIDGIVSVTPNMNIESNETTHRNSIHTSPLFRRS
jgi:hypothetical protein